MCTDNASDLSSESDRFNISVVIMLCVYNSHVECDDDYDETLLSSEVPDSHIIPESTQVPESCTDGTEKDTHMGQGNWM